VTATPNRKRAIAAVAVLLGLPPLLALGEAVSFHAANRSNGTIVSSGQKREYRLYVPRSYDPARPAPLVISLHGAGLWGAAQERTSRWDELAERYGFLVVYPSGAGGAGPRTWHVDRTEGLVQDVRFISALIDTLSAGYRIDATRIYANGLSNGGGMAFVLSCTLSDRIAAVGMVAAAQTLEWSWCPDHRPVPMIAFHGTADRLVPYQGGATPLSSTLVFPSVTSWTANWARRNRCGTSPVDSQVAVDVTRRTYPTCAGGADVVLYTLRGVGHQWPGGMPLPQWFVGPPGTGLDATSLIWAFFQEHPLPGK
jgi:polyhydroxybutyrate depolymerase